MGYTLTSGAETVTPDLVTDYSGTYESNTFFHLHLDFSLGASLATDTLRAGDLDLFFADAADAWAAVALLREARVWVLTSTSVPEIAMTFVRRRAMQPTLDRKTQKWSVRVGYQEMTP